MIRSLQTLFIILSVANATDLMISGVIEFSSASPDGLELYVINNIADLSIYTIEKYTGTSTTPAATFTFSAIPATAGDYIWFSDDNPTFQNYFGFTEDYNNAIGDSGGRESYVVKQNGVIVDIMGQIGNSVSGSCWQFDNSWTKRNAGAAPTATFNIADWTQLGVNNLSSCTTTDAACANAFSPRTFVGSAAVPGAGGGAIGTCPGVAVPATGGGGGPPRPRGPYGADPNKMKPVPAPTATIVTPAPVSPPPTASPPPTPSPTGTPKQTKKAKKQEEGAAEKRAKKLKDGARMRCGR